MFYDFSDSSVQLFLIHWPLLHFTASLFIYFNKQIPFLLICWAPNMICFKNPSKVCLLEENLSLITASLKPFSELWIAKVRKSHTYRNYGLQAVSAIKNMQFLRWFWLSVSLWILLDKHWIVLCVNRLNLVCCRSVAEQERPFALGMQFVLLRTLGE